MAQQPETSPLAQAGDHRSAPTRVFSLRLPKLIFGCGARHQVPAIAKQYGCRIFVVSDPGVAQQPLTREFLAELETAGFTISLFNNVVPDPPIQTALNCVAAARDAKADIVLGLGGGSSLDVAKVASVLVGQDLKLSDLFGTDLVPARGLPLIAIPSTAGTGSEVTPIAVLSDEERELKVGIVSDHLVPDYAVVDPDLSATLPGGPTAYTGMDTLTHAVEAYANRVSVPFIDGIALQAIELVHQNLARAVNDGTDRTAREGMALASFLGGICLGPVGVGAVHALAYPLGGKFHVPHGLANAMLLPHVIKFNEPAMQERYDRIGRLLGHSDAVTAIAALSEEVGTNRRLRDVGVGRDDLAEMARAAVQIERLMVRNPREMNAEQAYDVYSAAW